MAEITVLHQVPDGSETKKFDSGTYKIIKGGLGPLSGIQFHNCNGVFLFLTPELEWVKVFDHYREAWVAAELKGVTLSCELSGVEPQIHESLVFIGNNQDPYLAITKKHFGETIKDKFIRVSEEIRSGTRRMTQTQFIHQSIIPFAEQAYMQSLQILLQTNGRILLDDPNCSNLVVTINKDGQHVPVWIDGFVTPRYKNGYQPNFHEQAATIAQQMKKRFDGILDATGTISWEERCAQVCTYILEGNNNVRS